MNILDRVYVNILYLVPQNIDRYLYSVLVHIHLGPSLRKYFESSVNVNILCQLYVNILCHVYVNIWCQVYENILCQACVNIVCKIFINILCQVYVNILCQVYVNILSQVYVNILGRVFVIALSQAYSKAISRVYVGLETHIMESRYGPYRRSLQNVRVTSLSSLQCLN